MAFVLECCSVSYNPMGDLGGVELHQPELQWSCTVYLVTVTETKTNMASARQDRGDG